jgi:hypothetical protein
MPEQNNSATPTPEEIMLRMLKVDLGISSTAYDSRLGQYLTSAKAEIVREGVSFPTTLGVDDMQLIVMYATWMWKKRETGEGMPRMLRYLLNQRVFSQKMGGDSSD